MLPWLFSVLIALPKSWKQKPLSSVTNTLSRIEFEKAGRRCQALLQMQSGGGRGSLREGLGDFSGCREVLRVGESSLGLAFALALSFSGRP